MRRSRGSAIVWVWTLAAVMFSISHAQEYDPPHPVCRMNQHDGQKRPKISVGENGSPLWTSMFRSS